MTIAATDIHEIEIREGNRTPNRQMYVVRYRSEVILNSTRDPEWEAARVLVGRGLTGRLRARRAGSSTISFDIDLEKAAALAARDPDKGRLHIAHWTQYPSEGQSTKDKVDLPMAAE